MKSRVLLTNFNTLKNLLQKHNLWAKKRLGQNFLINPHILDKIIATAEIQKSDEILEIGPGPGVLTRELCFRAKKVMAVEKDAAMIPLLQETAREFKNLEIYLLDALKFRESSHFQKLKSYKLIANLPYNIATPLLRNFLQSKSPPLLIVVLTQLEVAQKICAAPPNMNVLGLTIQISGKPKIIAKIAPNSFFPAPKVTSAILRIQSYEKPLIPAEQQKKYFNFIHKAFTHKRKRLAKTLNIAEESLTALNLSENIRPQELSIEDWIRLIK